MPTSNLQPSHLFSKQVYCINLNLICPECGGHKCWNAGKTKDGRQRYRCKECNRTWTQDSQHGKYNMHLPLSDDVWLASDLGVSAPKHRALTKFVFIYIKQEWLKEIVKKFIRYMAVNRQFQTLTSYISELNCFSEFLLETCPSINFNNINRLVILDFLEYLKIKLFSAGAKSHYLSTLNTLFQVGTTNKWFNLTAGLILQADFPKHTRSLPRYIPEEVMQQLNQHLNALPEQVMRMVLVIQECGLRVGELLQLPFNCLRNDSKGDYFIQFMRGKTKRETALPISQELALVIQEQQQYIQEAFGKGNFDYLFCAKRKEPPGYHERFRPQSKPMRDDSFIGYLKVLAKKFDICDSSGKRWNFQTHQFRHTVGTRMVNSGIPLHIIQRYLGHASPEMTMTYAHIHDKTLRKEIEKYHEKRVFNVTGEVAEEQEQTVVGNDVDLEWFKKNVLAMALPHGWCRRPKTLGKCTLPPNSCLNCLYLRTNKSFIEVFKDELKRTNEVLAKAKRYGWEVQISMNEPIQENLEKLIKVLEADNE